MTANIRILHSETHPLGKIQSKGQYVCKNLLISKFTTKILTEGLKVLDILLYLACNVPLMSEAMRYVPMIL